MIPLTLDEVAELAPGQLQVAPGASRVTGLQTDSRRVEDGDLFVAVRGGVGYVDDALHAALRRLVPGEPPRRAGGARRACP